jgi:hypothetical protein
MTGRQKSKKHHHKEHSAAGGGAEDEPPRGSVDSRDQLFFWGTAPAHDMPRASLDLPRSRSSLDLPPRSSVDHISHRKSASNGSRADALLLLPHPNGDNKAAAAAGKDPPAKPKGSAEDRERHLMEVNDKFLQKLRALRSQNEDLSNQVASLEGELRMTKEVLELLLFMTPICRRAAGKVVCG